MKRPNRVTSISVLALACTAVHAARWTGAGNDRSWDTAENWHEGRLPQSTDAIRIDSPSGRGPVIDGDVTCGEIQGPVWDSDTDQTLEIRGGTVKVMGRWRFANRGRGVPTVTIRGGTLTVDGVWRWSDRAGTYGVVNVWGGNVRCGGLLIGDAGGGELNVRGSGHILVNGALSLGGARGQDPLKITMDGGAITVAGEFRCPSNRDRAGKVTVNLTAGSIHCAVFRHAGVPFSLDIAEGELTVEGDVRSQLEECTEKGYITAFGGDTRVTCRYDSLRDRTIVMAAKRKKAWNPRPVNRARDVHPGSMLEWNPGDSAQEQVVYFGASLDAVEPGAKPYRELRSSRRLEPRMGFGKTYYWRVDTRSESGVVLAGHVWQFATSSGKAVAPKPENGARNLSVDTTLSWEPAAVVTSYRVYMDTDPKKVRSAPVSGTQRSAEVLTNSFRPKALEFGRKYYWRVDAVNDEWSESPWRGDVWSFTVDSGKARNPRPMADAQWTPRGVTLKWEAAPTAVAHTVFFGKSRRDVAAGAAPVRSSQRAPLYAPGALKEATTYYWRVDEVYPDTVVRGEVWSFATAGSLHLKVDLALPQWEDTKQYRPSTAKPGWEIWAAGRWADMYMHDPVWFPSDTGGAAPDADGILGSGIHALLTTGGGGTGAVHAKGLSRGSLAGDERPYGAVEGDPIANTYYYACDWAGPKLGDALLALTGLPAGEYELHGYHNFWEPTGQHTRNRRDAASKMPPMPTVTVHAFPPEPLPGNRNWSIPKGNGAGVTAVKNGRNVPVTSTLKDGEVSRSVVRFATDGSGVLVIYEAPNDGYKDRARSGREGGRGVLNAFELKLTKWAKK